MKKLILFLTLSLLFLSCIQHYYAGLPARPTEAVVLTLDMIKKYQLDTEKFKLIHVYLGNELVISREITREEANSGRHKNLTVRKDRTMEELTFPRWVRGNVIGMKKAATFWQKLQNKHTFLLLVSFEDKNGAYLTFKPNNSGGYILETLGDGHYVKYNSSTYRCVSDCNYIELLVDLEIEEDNSRQTRVVPGR
ncbi:hypothetical protein JW935_25990 [candidate division KSB1 bacterium]|nr:hypothetical protein [candidate division KSB1 bacterium]